MQLTPRDRALLEFVAEHRLVLSGQVRAFLGVKRADDRLRALARAGYLTRTPLLAREPWCIQITRAGLSAIGSALPVPRCKLDTYRHDVGLAWLWLAAHRGIFGDMREVIGERRMRSLDGVNREGRRPFGVRLGGVGPGGRERLHYPDLLMSTRDGRRVAVELELSWKGPARTARILAAYGADARLAGILYLVESRATGRSVERCARALGISDLVEVQMVVCAAPRPGGEHGRGGERGRGVERPRVGLER